MTCGHIRDSGGGNDCDGCLSVSHQSPDTDVSDADAEIFEVQLNSAKFLSAGRTCVGGCTYVHVYLCDTVCALMRQEVAVCQAPLINLHFHVLTYYFKHWRCKSQLKRYITLCLVNLNLHNNTVQLQQIIKPQNQLSQRTAVKINHGHKKA